MPDLTKIHFLSVCAHRPHANTFAEGLLEIRHMSIEYWMLCVQACMRCGWGLIDLVQLQQPEPTNMAQYEVQVIRGLSHEAAAFLYQVSVAGPMGSILAYAMLSANVLGQSVCEGAWSHCLMKCSVKDSHLHATHSLPLRIYSNNMFAKTNSKRQQAVAL